jgi:hypothetical protein
MDLSPIEKVTRFNSLIFAFIWCLLFISISENVSTLNITQNCMTVVECFAKGTKGAGKSVFVASLNFGGVNPQKYLPISVRGSKGLGTLPDLTQ